MDTSADNLLLPEKPGIQKMDPRVKKLWVDALRSGEYNQALGSLMVCGIHFNSYCCLGVLCDLHAKEFGNKWENSLYLGEGCGLPDEVALWAGISPYKNDVPVMQEDELYISAATLNDSRNKTFDQIADLIEENL